MAKLQKIARRTEQVPLYTNEDQDRLTELLDAIEEARAASLSAPARRGDAPVTEAAAAYDAFVPEAIARASLVNITALPKKQWRKMLLDYPPRADVTNEAGEVVERFPEDRQHGFNVELIADPLVVASIDLDQFDSEDERQEWVDELDDPKFSRIFSAAVRINGRDIPDPKWSASSWIALTSGLMSRLPDPSAEESASSSDSPSSTGSSSEPTG